MVAATRNGHHAEAPAATVVYLVGTATSSRDLVNDAPEDAEVWGLNASYDWMPRQTRWFEMHDRARFDHFQESHIAALKALECPIYMVKHYEDIPNSIPYPLAEVTQGGRFRSLFTSSVSYMIAMAVAEGFQEIRFAGIDMAMDSEYAYQRSACEYWIGVADALGLKVIIPESSPIGRAPLYGQEVPQIDRSIVDWKDRIANEKLRKYERFITELHQLLDENRMDFAAVEGARQVLEKMGKQDS